MGKFTRNYIRKISPARAIRYCTLQMPVIFLLASQNSMSYAKHPHVHQGCNKIIYRPNHPILHGSRLTDTPITRGIFDCNLPRWYRMPGWFIRKRRLIFPRGVAELITNLQPLWTKWIFSSLIFAFSPVLYRSEAITARVTCWDIFTRVFFNSSLKQKQIRTLTNRSYQPSVLIAYFN